ncbi:MAG: preprotein translocase subunit SecE [Clostridiales Family XIII bacterium]|jgi:preprotein translocase subunit SecE|nr:preprotein translocase subunit SecE [Clostridiales Family XIII bacterium]
MPGKDKDKGKGKQTKTGKPERKSALEKATAAAKAADKKRKPAAAADRKRRGGFKEYFKGVKIETKKVVWPTRRELISYTVVVLFTCAFFGLMIWGVDSAFLVALRKLVGIDM